MADFDEFAWPLQVLLPAGVRDCDLHLLDGMHHLPVVQFSWLTQGSNISSLSLTAIASPATSDDVLPRILTSTAPRQHMVTGQFNHRKGLPTILASIQIPNENIAFGEVNAESGPMVFMQNHHAGNLDACRRRTAFVSIPFQHINLAKIVGLDTPLPAHYAEWIPAIGLDISV